MAWLAASKIQSGAVLGRGGVVGEPLSAAAVRDIGKKRCALAGIEGIAFSVQSLRSGIPVR